MDAATHRAPSSPRDPFDRVVVRDAVVIGSGVAGLTAALGCAPRSAALLTLGGLGEDGSSWLAQGGVAAALGDEDDAELHSADTLAVGGGLGDGAVARLLTREGRRRIEWLLELGARFDRRPDGSLALGREAAHSRRRILHAAGDATGAELVRTLRQAVLLCPEVAVFEGMRAVALVRWRGRIAGVIAERAEGGSGGRKPRRTLFVGRGVVLATGGIGGLYAATTNPASNSGDGLALAALAGARLIDLEMVQFHPTALAVAEGAVAEGAVAEEMDGAATEGSRRMPLLTEALRGEGAVLVDGDGRRFMLDEHPDGELAPRDVVARAIARRRAAGGEVFLDARRAVGQRFPERFPTVFELCRRAGYDPRRQPLPVAPAAHYHMGGIATDADGRTSLAGLWACGEVASTGAHGANRLASNSLLEALVFGGRVAADLRRNLDAPLGAGALDEVAAAARAVLHELPSARSADRRSERLALARVRRIMACWVGVERSGDGLARALTALDRIAGELAAVGATAPPGLLAARLVTRAALLRTESRGGHFRADHPAPDPAWAFRLAGRLGAAGDFRPERLPGQRWDEVEGAPPAAVVDPGVSPVRRRAGVVR